MARSIVTTLDVMRASAGRNENGTRRGPCGRGRFAPSPTGELHFGSIVAAVASFLDARTRGEEWLVRIDDLDAPRVVPGAIAAILRELDRLELHWDGEVVHQSARTERYADALDTLRAKEQCFPCACTRREVGGRVYPGTCRRGVPPGRRARSVRVRAHPGWIGFEDLIQGPCRRDIERELGDFIVHRADGVYAYHFATAIDDAEQSITRVVRGADLRLPTLAQVYLQDLLGRARPEYAHVPVATSPRGEKLGKQTRASPTRLRPASQVIADALRFLGHPLPGSLVGAPPEELWAWAIGEWDLAQIPRVLSRVTPNGGGD